MMVNTTPGNCIVYFGVADADAGDLVDELVGALMVKRTDGGAGSTPWTVLLSLHTIERESMANDRVQALLDGSSFGGAGARRVRRGVRATDAARAVAVANGAPDPVGEELGAATLDLRSSQAARRLRGARRLAALVDHSDAPARVRRSALIALAGHVRPHLDLHADEPADVAAAHQALVRAGGRDRALSLYLLTYLYRDRLRRFAVDLVPDTVRGDHLADDVLQQGADTIYTQVKTRQECAAPSAETESAAACTLWLIALTLQTATEQGELPDAGTRMAYWSEYTVAMSAGHFADAGPIGDVVGEGRSVLVDLHRLPRGDTSRFVQSCVDLAGDGAWTVPVRDTAFLIRPDCTFPDGPATRRRPDALPARHDRLDAADHAVTVVETGEAPVAVGVKDLAEDAEAVRLAAAIAVRTGRPLRIVHAYVGPLELPKGRTGGEREHAERTVEDAAAGARAKHPELDISAEVADGDPTQVLLRAASKAGLLVLRHDTADDPTESVLFQVVARAASPVLYLRGEDRPGPVVVGVDGSADAAVGLEIAVEEARRRQTGLVVLHAEGAPCSEPLGETAGVPVEHRKVDGPADQALLDASADAQLVVVGAQGARPILLGPVTQRLLRHAECPVLVSRTTGRGSSNSSAYRASGRASMTPALARSSAVS